MKKFFIAVALGTGLFAAQAVNAQSAPTTAKKNVATNPVTATAPPARSERTAMAHHPRAHKQARTNDRARSASDTRPERKVNVPPTDRSTTAPGTENKKNKEMKKHGKAPMRSEEKKGPSSGSKH